MGAAKPGKTETISTDLTKFRELLITTFTSSDASLVATLSVPTNVLSSSRTYDAQFYDGTNNWRARLVYRSNVDYDICDVGKTSGIARLYAR